MIRSRNRARGGGIGLSVPSKLSGMLAGQSLDEYKATRGTPRVFTEYAKNIGSYMGYTVGTVTNYTGTPQVASDASTKTGTDYKVRIVNAASGGSAAVDQSSSAQVTAGNYWWNTQDNSATSPFGALDATPNTAGPLLRALISYLSTYSIDFIDWSQGQTDAAWVDLSSANETIYEDTLKKIFAAIRTATGNANLPIFINHICRGNVAGESSIEKIAKIQSKISKEGSFIFIGTEEYLADFAIAEQLANCTFTSGSTTITTINTTNLGENQEIRGTGIPDNTYVVSINAGVSFVISNATTSAQTNITLYRMDGTHLYPGSDGVQPLDSNGNTTHDVTQGFYAVCKRMSVSISRWYKTRTSKRNFGIDVSAVSASYNSTNVDLTIQHDQGTDLTSIAGSYNAQSIKPFRVELNGAAQTINSLSKTSSTGIRLALANPLSYGTLKVWPAYGAMNKSDYRYFVTDNATPPTPLLRKSPDLYSELVVTIPAPSRADAQTTGLSNVVAQWDATLSGSYNGSGSTWTNVIATPADGSASSSYNQTISGMTFNGSAGAASAYFSASGSSFFELTGANTTFLDNLHKTTGGSDFTVIVAYQVAATTAATLFSTSNTTTSLGVMIDTSTTTTFRQRGDTASSNVSGGTVSTGTWYLLIYTHSAAGSSSMRWLNTKTGSLQGHTFNTTTSSSTVNMHVASRNDSANFIPSGSFIAGVTLLNSYIDDITAAMWFDYYNNLHGRTYA